MNCIVLSVATPLPGRDLIELKRVFRLKRRLVNPMRIEYPTGAFYRGETTDTGIRHGWGEILYTDNTVIAGHWVNGKICGKGVLMRDEFTYKGDFKDDLFNGRGQLTDHIDGDHYTGEFVNNGKTGKGKMVWPNGNYYIGEWKENDICGAGILRADDKVYCGNWVDGQLSQEGFVIRLINTTTTPN